MAGERIGDPTECDLFRTRGDTKDFAIVVTGTNVQGWTGLLTVHTIKDPPDSSTQIYQSSGVEDPESPQTLGRMVFDFTDFATQSPQLVPGTYYYDVQLTDAASKICTVLKGKFVIGQDRTK